jgi:hypothetical protein
MANVVKYSLTTQADTLKIGNVLLGTNAIEYGPTSSTKFWNGVEVPVNGYVMYIPYSSGSGMTVYSINNDTELVKIVNEIGLQNYTTAAQALAWAGTQTGLVLVNETYPNVSTSNLSLLYDAGFIPSYPKVGTAWYDSSGNNVNGTLLNGVSFNSLGALTFDGTDDYITTGSVNIGNPNTVISVIKLNGVQNSSSGAGSPGSTIYLPTANGFDNWLGISSTSVVSLFVTELSDIGNYELLGATTLDTTNTRWYFVASVISGSIATIYLNGVQDATTTRSYTIGSWNSTAIIGSRGGSQRLFKGSISRIQAYNRVLSQSEILQSFYQASIVTSGIIWGIDAGNLVSYESGSTTAYSFVDSTNGTLYNGVGFSTENSGTWSFDGTDDGIRTSNVVFSSATSSLSFNFWVRSTSATSASQSIFAKDINVGNAPHILIRRNNGNDLIWNFNNGVGASTLGFTNFFLGYNNTWVNVQVVADYSADIIQVYRNGSLFGQQNQPSAVFPNTNTSILVGSFSNVGFLPFNGNIANAYVYNTALTAAEVLQNFNAQRARFGV